MTATQLRVALGAKHDESYDEHYIKVEMPTFLAIFVKVLDGQREHQSALYDGCLLKTLADAVKREDSYQGRHERSHRLMNEGWKLGWKKPK